MKFNLNSYSTKTFLFFFGILISTYYNSQIKVKVCKPSTFNSPWTSQSLKSVIDEGAHCQDGNAFWIIRSMADGIQTYKDPQRNSPNTTLKYLQRFVVQNIKGKMLHIYDYEPLGPKEISDNAKDWGWVSIHDVLPSDFPKSKQEDNIVFTEKAMPTYILRERSYQKDIKEIKFYRSFDGDKLTGNGVVSQIPYYVFAKKGRRYLLSNKANVSIREGDIIESEMGGWIESEYVQIIKDRVCWEPCWEESSYNLYKDLDFYVYHENKKDNAVGFRNRGINNKDHVISTKYQVKNGRQNLKGRRAIQTDRVRSGVVKVLVRGNADENVSPEYMEKIGKKANDLKESLRKLNILFVIDGTKSMQPYFESTARAIEESMKELDKMGSRKSSIVNEINFAVGVYRDKKNIITKSYEYKEFTPSNRFEEITKFLRSVQCDSKGDKDIAENVYEGLYNSMQKFKKNQKNVVILIGDAGDHQSSENDKQRHKSLEKKIIQLSNQFDVSWSVFQVNRKKAKDEYNDFISNAKKIIAISAKKINESSKSKHKFLRSEKNFYLGNYTTTLDLDYNENEKDNLEDYLMFGKVVQPEDGSFIKDELLTEAITNSIINMHNSTKSMIRFMEGDHNSIPYRRILKAKGLSDKDIDLLNDMGFRIPGHLPINTEKGALKYEDAMCKVLMFTPGELQSQKKLLKELAEASKFNQGSAQKEIIIKVLTEKMVQVTGNAGAKNISEIRETIQSYLLNDVWRSLFGKDFTYDKEKGRLYSISDMQYQKNFSNSWMSDFADELADKYDLIKGESVNNCKYKEKTGIKSGNNSDYLLYYSYDKFFP